MSGTPDELPSTAADRALRQQFLHGMSYAAATVNVVTTDGVAGRHGVTVSAMVSVSADTPQPTLLVCIHHLSPVVAAVLENLLHFSRRSSNWRLMGDGVIEHRPAHF